MVNIQDLSLAFGGQVLFEHLDLTLLLNEWVSLLGCSGVGKSTLLRLIAGLDIQGKIQGNIISHPNIRVSWLPQKDTLYPWLSIVDNVQLENVLFGNKSAKTTIRAKVLLEQVGMSEHLNKNCTQLSGGQKQSNIIPIKSGLRRLSFIFFPLITRSIIAVGASTNCFGLDLVVLYLQVL